jgi:adenylate kinase
MTGKKVIITGVPGVGKTSVITRAIARLEEEGIPYQNINFGSFMFEVAQKEGIADDRDQMRKLSKDAQKRLQQLASQAIARINGNIVIDTHASVKTPSGFLAGLPEWVLREIKPDMIILVENDEDQILKRRLSDLSRVRDIEGGKDIASHQSFNRAVAAAYAMMTGCTIKCITNADFLLDNAVEEMVNSLK